MTFSAYDVIQNLFPDKSKDFVFNITESDIVLVKEVATALSLRIWKSWHALFPIPFQVNSIQESL